MPASKEPASSLSISDYAIGSDEMSPYKPFHCSGISIFRLDFLFNNYGPTYSISTSGARKFSSIEIWCITFLISSSFVWILASRLPASSLDIKDYAIGSSEISPCRPCHYSGMSILKLSDQVIDFLPFSVFDEGVFIDVIVFLLLVPPSGLANINTGIDLRPEPCDSFVLLSAVLVFVRCKAFGESP